MILQVPIDYQTFTKDRYPRIGVYYMFENYNFHGLCCEFLLNLDGLARTIAMENEIPSMINDTQIIFWEQSFQFKKEDWLID